MDSAQAPIPYSIRPVLARLTLPGRRAPTRPDERVYYNLATLYSKPEWDWFHHSVRVTAPTAILPGDWPELGDDYPPEPYVWDRETIGDAKFHQMREDGLI